MESFSNKENTHSNGPSNGSATAVHSGLAVKPEVPAAAVLVDRMKLQSYELMRLLNSYVRCKRIYEVSLLDPLPPSPLLFVPFLFALLYVYFSI